MKLLSIHKQSAIDDGGTKIKLPPKLNSLQNQESLSEKLLFEGGDENTPIIGSKSEIQRKEDQEKPAGDEFLIWEPKGLKQKIKAFLSNAFESIYVLLIALIALLYSSIIAAFFFILSTFMFLSQNQSIKVRYLYGQIILFVQLIMDIIIVVVKVLQIKQMNKTADTLEDFQKKVKFYESIGYSLIQYESDLRFEVDQKASFQMESCLFVLIIIGMLFSFKQSRILQKLQKTPKKDIIQLIDLENPQEDDESKKVGIGTQDLDREKQESLQNDIENNKKALKHLQKSIKKNFVESVYFYNQNQKFFVFALIFQFIQMMSYNSLLDLPILIIVLILVAFYDLRKSYSVLYRTYCFFVIYWMQIIMIIKLIHDILVRTQIIKSWLTDDKNKDQTITKLNSILFGSHNQQEQKTDDELGYYISGIFISIFCCQSWKNTKWMEIREKTTSLKSGSSLKRFVTYMSERAKEDVDTKKFQQEIIETKLKKQKENSDIKKDKQKKQKHQTQGSGKYDVGKSYQKAKQDKSQYLPLIVLWLCRINLFVLSYIYHSGLSFVNLTWVILSFLLSQQNTFFFSTFIMVPLLTWEFLLIYGSRVQILNEQPIFRIMNSYFTWEMQNQSLEQVYMYFTLAVFYVMISCFMKSIQPQQNENSLLEFFRKRIQSQKYSNIWKYIFLCCPHIQSIFLLALFLKGSTQINTLVNLGYLIFFVLYTAYINIYRKTGFILVVFVSFFILAQYYVSLNYKLYMKNDLIIKSMYWFNIFPYENLDEQNIFKNPFNIKDDNDMYWRLGPQYSDWAILILMSVLDNVNQMYKSPKIVQKYTEECLDGIKESASKVTYYYGRVKNIITGLLIYLAMISMILIHQFIQTNMINWAFFILNLIVFGMMIFYQKSHETLQKMLNISVVTKYFALFIIIFIIFFILVIGSREKVNQPHSLDQKFKAQFPKTYAFIPLIGLRDFSFKNKIETDDEINDKIKYKLITYVWFFMVSLYLCSHFEKERKISKESDNFEEEDYKKLFEYIVPNGEEAAQLQKQNKQNNIDGEEKSIYQKKIIYVQRDLFDFYEGTRFTLPFMVYRQIKYWDYFDFIAKNGHFLNYSLMVILALYYSTSFYMCINIILICFFYIQSSRNLGNRAILNNKISGLQSQCDIKIAQLITKRYKQEQFYEFLRLRQSVWKLQFFFFILAIIVSYPTMIIHQLKNLHSIKENVGRLENLKTVTFWFYLTGILKKEDPSDNGYQKLYFLLLIGLIFDRLTINWLTNRFGCNYFKLQKYIELDQRREAIRYNWETRNPTYDIERYRKLYFLNDFDDLKERFQSRNYKDMMEKREESAKAANNDNKKKGLVKYPLAKSENDYQKQLFGDYIPPKVGMRIFQFVKFSILLDCQSPETNQDDETKQKLKTCDQDEDFDIEQIGILKDFKLIQLRQILQQNVDLKYKISFSKGMMIVSEQIILMMMSLSLVLKANVFSLIYMIFIVRYVFSKNKLQLLPRFNNYMVLCFTAQYILYLLNLSPQTSANPYPTILKNEIFVNNKPKYAIPVFFHYEDFKNNMLFGYLLGIGIEQKQIQILIVDFFIIYFISMYVLEFKNPIFLKSMKKVFWQYPTILDSQQKWERLTPEVKQQVDFFQNPNNDEISAKNSEKKKDYYKLQIKQQQFNFALDYKKYTKIDLNYLLTNYADLKYQKVWADDFLTEIKGEMKQNSMYYRIVKQGSVLTYLTFHVVTIFVILLMATMRQSVISLIYVFMLLPRLKNGIEVLKQRDVEVQKNVETLESQIQKNEDTLQQKVVYDQIEQKLKDKQTIAINEVTTQSIQKYLKSTNDEIQQFKINIMKERYINDVQYQEISQYLLQKETLVSEENLQLYIIALVEQLRILTSDQIQSLIQENQIKRSDLQFLKKKLNKSTKIGSQVQKSENKQWIMITIIINYLSLIALIDFSIQAIFQLPNIHFEKGSNLDIILDWAGLRKVWNFPTALFDPNFFQIYYSNTQDANTITLTFDKPNFFNQMMNCIIINSVLFQKEIYLSNGYVKFVTQQNGTLDYLLQLSELKAKSLSFIFNNYKIRKIISIQQRREQILATVEKVKQKIVRWREFTRTTLVNTAQKPKEIEEAKDLQIQLLKTESEIIAPCQEFVAQKIQKISRDEAEGIFDVLAYEFVEAKKVKLRLCVRFNIWLNKTFCQQIMFKNKKSQLLELNKMHAQCFVEIPTELESIMFKESKDLIQQFYDSKEGIQELSVNCKKYQGPRTLIDKMKVSEQSEGYPSLLDMTNIDKKIKLKQMIKTWEFTRTLPLVIRNIETFFYIMISQTQTFIYFGMITSMYQNAGVISIFYPISVFGYALLEETRPRKQFWDLVRNYTSVLLFLKFILNLSMFEQPLKNEQFIFINGLIQIGIYDYDSIVKLILYMMPEILIISFIMLNEIKLKLLGILDENEEDIEPLQDAIQRNLMDGDEEKMIQNKIEKQNMCMQRCFIERQEQIFFMQQHQKELKNDIAAEFKNLDKTQLLNIVINKENIDSKEINEIRETCLEEQFSKRYPIDEQMEQSEAISEISKLIWKTSRNFDLDSAGKKTKFDMFIAENVIQKSLESDNLLFVEGHRPQYQHNFLSKQKFIEERKLEHNWDNISSGDFEADFNKKFDVMESRQLGNPSMFEKSNYFQRVFPSLKIQKPGADYYGASSCILAIIIIYILMCFKYYTVDQDVFKFVAKQSSIFKSEMAYTIVFLIMIMMVERYASRTDTKKNENNDYISEVYQQKQKQQRFFSNKDIFQRQKTERSMTVKLQTVKTKNLDVQNASSQSFLKQQIEKFKDDSDDQNCTMITSQQKTKFFLHWIMLIIGHFYVFWYIPIKGNYHLYGQPQCKNDGDQSDYQCKDFHSNLYLRILYAFIVIYLWISAIQISLGFPIMKKPSSVLQYYSDIAKVGADIYISIPFACEARCLLDWTMSKTALDIFQFFQLYNHHYELYSAKIGNKWYGQKILGSITPIQEKCIFSGIFSSIIILLLVGPFYLFSDNSPLVDINPVLNGNIGVNFIVFEALKGNITDIDTYNIYENQNLLLRTFSQKRWSNQTEISSGVKTRNFEPRQTQECFVNEYSDYQWKISNPQRQQLYQSLQSDKLTDPNKMNVSIQLDIKLKRALPDSSTEAYLKINKTLNYSLFHDCKAGQELKQLAQLNCSGDENKNNKQSITIRQVYNPLMLLGITNAINEVYGQSTYGIDMTLQRRNDIMLTYQCDGTWSIKGKQNYTEFDQKQLDAMMVNSSTCSLTKTFDNFMGVQNVTLLQQQEEDKLETERNSGRWTAIKLILFSMIVSTSYLAAYSPQTFYTGVAVMAFYALRPAFIYSTWCSIVWECNNPDPIIKVVEACYLHRHEENLIGEEETYCLLREIFRSPEFIKALSGSSLKGSTSPELDNLSKDQKKKLVHLDMLEQKGFEVTALKQKIFKSAQKDQSQF